MVTYEDAASLGAIRKWAEDQLREALEKDGIDMARVGPLLIFNTHDIELLEALTHKTEWVRLIREFADYVQAHRDDPIATFDVFFSKSNPTVGGTAIRVHSAEVLHRSSATAPVEF